MHGIEFFRETTTIPSTIPRLLPYNTDERNWASKHTPESIGRAYGCYEFDKKENSYLASTNIDIEQLRDWLDEAYFYSN